jgi:hypothetical protein
MQREPVAVARYCGQNQQHQIMVSDAVALREGQPEDGPSVMVPYASLFPQPPAQSLAFLPPPVQKTDLFTAQQTWPL